MRASRRPLTTAVGATVLDGARLQLESALRDCIRDGDVDGAAAAATALALRNRRDALLLEKAPKLLQRGKASDAAAAKEKEDPARLEVDVRIVDTTFVDFFPQPDGADDAAEEEAARQFLAVFMHYFSHEFAGLGDALRFHVRSSLQRLVNELAAVGDDGERQHHVDEQLVLSAIRHRIDGDAAVAVRTVPLVGTELAATEAMRQVRDVIGDSALQTALEAKPRTGGRMRSSAPMSKGAIMARGHLLNWLMQDFFVGNLNQEEITTLHDDVNAYTASTGGNVEETREAALSLMLRDRVVRKRELQGLSPAAAKYDAGIHEDVGEVLGRLREAFGGPAATPDTAEDLVQQASRAVLQELNSAAREGGKAMLIDAAESEGGSSPSTQGATDDDERREALAAARTERNVALAMPLPPMGMVHRMRVAVVPRAV